MSNFLLESLKSFFWGEKCPKHPGHRDRELNVDELTDGALFGRSCSLCFAESQRYPKPGLQSIEYVNYPTSTNEVLTPQGLVGIDKFALLERCEQEAICPNGCGPLVQKSYTLQECPTCGFRHFNASPERKPHATE
jgi:rRNA maturation protein Nop10